MLLTIQETIIVHPQWLNNSIHKIKDNLHQNKTTCVGNSQLVGYLRNHKRFHQVVPSRLRCRWSKLLERTEHQGNLALTSASRNTHPQQQCNLVHKIWALLSIVSDNSSTPIGTHQMVKDKVLQLLMGLLPAASRAKQVREQANLTLEVLRDTLAAETECQRQAAQRYKLVRQVLGSPARERSALAQEKQLSSWIRTTYWTSRYKE